MGDYGPIYRAMIVFLVGIGFAAGCVLGGLLPHAGRMFGGG